MKKQMLLGILIAIVCLYFAFRGISITGLFHALRTARLRWIACALMIYSIGYILRAFRWRILMEPIRRCSAGELFAPMIIGFLANNILPFRMGEFIRAHVTGTKFNVSRTASLGTILLERLCDTVSFLSTFIAVALIFPFPGVVEKGAAALGLLCILVTASLVIILRHRDRFQEVVEKLRIPQNWKRTIEHLVGNFAQGVSSLKKARHVAGALLLSLVIWTIEGSYLYLIAKSLSAPLSYPQAFFLLFFMGLAVTLPQAPGYIGTLELFGVTALALLGIPKQQALPVILSIHGTQFCFILAVGMWALYHEGISLNSLIKRR